MVLLVKIQILFTPRLLKVCADCGNTPHDVKHLFACSSDDRTVELSDLCNPPMNTTRAVRVPFCFPHAVVFRAFMICVHLLLYWLCVCCM